MTIIYYTILTIHILACLFLITVVLLQQGKGQDLASAFGGGGSQTAFGPRGSANILSRTTTVLAGVFMLTSLGLSILRPAESSILDQLPAAPTEQSAPATTAPAASSETSDTAPAAPAETSDSAPAESQQPAPATQNPPSQ